MSKKIIHVLGAMDAGGVEAWLMDVLRNSDPSKFKHEFLVQKDKKAFFDDEILSLGSNIHLCRLNNIISYTYNLYIKLKQLQPDIVHSHVGTFSGVVLLVSRLAGVKCRISHSHNDFTSTDHNSKLFRKLYLKIMKQLIQIFSTHNIAVSEQAAQYLYGKSWKENPKTQIIYCAVDEKKFRDVLCQVDYHKQLNIPKDSIVLGHVGSFSVQKNHNFLLELFLDLYNKNKNYYLILVGSGPLRNEVENKVLKLGLESNVRFLGNRTDIPEIMSCLFDIFLFPSHYEGLGLVAVEAQLTGLHVIASTNVPVEADCGNLSFLKLDKDLWLKYIDNHNLYRSPHKYNTDRFSLVNNIELINRVYSNC